MVTKILKTKQISKFKETNIGKIPIDWGVKKISEVDSSKNCVQTGPFGSLLHSYDYQEEGYPLILVKHVKDGKIIEENLPKIGKEKYSELSKFILKEGDIVFTRVGYVGNAAYVEDKHAGWLFSGQTLRIRIKNPIINNKFVSYFFLTDNFKNIASSVVLGSTRDSINTQILKDILIPIPSKKEQDKIVLIITSIKNKINTLQNQNKILEQIAQTIFKSWFIDFDGVTQFEDSELGKIPKGWNVTAIRDVIEFVYGKSLTKKNRNSGKIPVYGSSGVVGFHDKYLSEGPGIIVGRKGNVGSLYWSEIPFYAIDTVYYIKTELPFHFVYQNFKNQNFINSDSSVPGLQRDQAYSLPIIIPDNSTLEKFELIGSKIQSQLEINNKKIDEITLIHKILIPKLMSGEIRV